MDEQDQTQPVVDEGGVLPPAPDVEEPETAPEETAAAEPEAAEPAPEPVVPEAALQQVVSQLQAAGADPDRQRAALKHAAALAASVGITADQPGDQPVDADA